MTFCYLFSESAREKDYKQKVVQPTVEKILGGKLDEEINTNLIGHIPGFSHGRIEGIFKIN
ncbi:11700_t:CDS:1, partial [Ambispora leptoticha]